MKYEQTKELKTPNYYQDENGEDLFSKFRSGLITSDEFIGFLKGNAFKYLERYNLKNQKSSDLYKLKDYVNTLVNFMISYDNDYLKQVKSVLQNSIEESSTIFESESVIQFMIFNYLKTINRAHINSMEEKKNLVLLVLLVDELIEMELGVKND